jgi:multidrug resistance efflux pump
LNVDNVGIVVNVRVVPGDHVEPGDTLLTLSTGGQEARQAKLDFGLEDGELRQGQGGL